jgi:hypothetical protein
MKFVSISILLGFLALAPPIVVWGQEAQVTLRQEAREFPEGSVPALQDLGPGSLRGKGVDWEVPEDYQEAAQDLLEMKLMGVNTVRTGLLLDGALLSMADSLGLLIYRELPFFGLNAQILTDSLVVSDSLVALLLESGIGHPSAGPIGLTRLSDTSSIKACEAIRTVSSQIREAGALSYYVSSFVESDVCSEDVDFVLLDALDDEHPELLLDRWRSAHREPAGLARVGTHLLPGSEAGSLVVGSLEYQARFLENVFARTKHSGVAVIFLHRWKDERDITGQIPDPYGRKYGLYNRTGDPRPALYVMRGVYLGTQETFAYDRGQPSPRPLHWFALVGWILLSMMAVIYAGSPRFRSIIPRYFFAHGFYRNAVREAREVLPLTSTAILTITGLSIGLIATHVISSLRETKLVLHLFSMMNVGMRSSLTLVLDAPFVLAILAGSTALIAMSTWMGIWIMASGRRSPLYPSQALMLAVWPRWQVLFILPVAMTFESVAGTPTWAIALLAATWIGCAYWATLRTAFDLYRVARITPGAATLIWMLNPLILGSVVFSGWALFHAEDVAFLWHLATKN